MPVRVSIRYFAKVAAWSELPRAQVTTARGAMLRTTLPELIDEVAVRVQLRANRGRSGGRFPEHAGIGIHGRAELGDEVVGVAAIVGLRELDRAAVLQESEPFDQQTRVARLRAQQLGLLARQQHGAQALQRAHRPVAGPLQRLVERGLARHRATAGSRRRSSRTRSPWARRPRSAAGGSGTPACRGSSAASALPPGVTVPFERLSQSLRGLRPRARMSSEKEVSIEKFFSTRPRTKVPEPVAAHQQAFAHEPVDGLAHGDPRNAELAGEVALGRQRIVGVQDAPVDRLAQRALQLLVERQIARFRERADGLREQRRREAPSAGPAIAQIPMPYHDSMSRAPCGSEATAYTAQ